MAASSTVAAGGGYVVVAGDTLSAIARRNSVTLAALVAVNGWTDGADHPIFPGDRIVLPAGATPATSTTGAPTTTARSTTTAATPTTTAAPRASLGGYSATGQQYAGPATGDRTSPITSPLADGVYWAGLASAANGQVVFTLEQEFFGDACRETIGTGDDDCLGDRGTTGPTGTAPLAPNAAATVIDDSRGTIAAWRVSTGELVRLIGGQQPSADAPSGYRYADLPFVVTVRNGAVVAADQRYIS